MVGLVGVVPVDRALLDLAFRRRRIDLFIGYFMQYPLGCNLQVGLHDVNRPRGVDDDDLARLPPGLGQKAVANSGVELQPLHFHPIGIAVDPRGSRFGGQVQHDGQVGKEAAGGYAANLPKSLDVEATAIALVNHVGQQVSIGDDDFASLQRRPYEFGSQLRSSCHVEEHFASSPDGQVMPMEQQIANRLAQRCAARVAAGDHRLPLLAKPLAKEVDLC